MTVNSPSEFEFYREMLIRWRRSYYIYGRLLATGGLLVICTISLFLPYIISVNTFYHYSVWHWLAIGILYAGSIASLIAGIRLLRFSRTLPTEQEIIQARQKERRRLFQEAQGHLPWGYRSIGQALAACLGTLFAIGGAITLFLFGLTAWDGWAYLTISVFLFALAFVYLPRYRRTIPQDSATRLTNNLLRGETFVNDEQQEK